MSETYELNNAERSIFPGLPGDRSGWLPENGCGCFDCVSTVELHGLPATAFVFIVCPLCGNKRCPKGTNHNNECTNSNESEQAGSRYGGL